MFQRTVLALIAFSVQSCASSERKGEDMADGGGPLAAAPRPTASPVTPTPKRTSSEAPSLPGRTAIGDPSFEEEQLYIAHYLPLWRQLFLEHTGMSQSERDRRVREAQPRVRCWMEGCVLQVSYTVLVDWLELHGAENMQFLVFEAPSRAATRGLPRNVALSDADVRSIAAARSSVVLRDVVPPDRRLAFRSLEEVRGKMKENAAVDVHLKDARLRPFGRRAESAFDLFGLGVLDRGANRCVAVKADLTSGQIEANAAPCAIP